MVALGLWPLLPLRHLFLIFLLLRPSRGCGVLTHNTVLRTASHLFSHPTANPSFSLHQTLISPLLLNTTHSPSLQAGAFFPDYGYQCFNTDGDSEAAHWPPFLVASVEHIRHKYSPSFPRSSSRSDAEQAHIESLIAFIFATASHQTADATWHGIRLPTGLLEALAEIDYGGSRDRAHKALDFGGDFLFAARSVAEGQEWIEASWTVPVDDLIEIYKRLGRTPNKYVMEYCITRGLAALRSELVFGEQLLEPFAKESPMLLDSVDGYYLGGVEEMTARTVGCWQKLAKWMVEGIDEAEKVRDGWGVCDVFEAIAAKGGAGGANRRRGRSPLELPELLYRTLEDMKDVRVTRDQFGASTFAFPPLSLPATDTGGREDDDNWKPPPEFANPTFVSAYLPHSHMGASLASFDLAGQQSVAISSPSETSDSSYPNAGNVVILPLAYLSPPAALGPFGARTSTSDRQPAVVNERFGTSLTQYRGLNRTFLVVSAPGPLTFPNAQSVAGRISLFLPGEVAGPAMTITIPGTGNTLGRAGGRWAGVDLVSVAFKGSGEYLVVSAPYSDVRGVRGQGEVYVLRLVRDNSTFGNDFDITVRLGNQEEEEEEEEEGKREAWAGLRVEAHHITLPEPSTSGGRYSYFGSSVVAHSDSDTLYISCPGTNRIYAFTLTAGGNSFEHTGTLDADSETRIGPIAALPNNRLAVASPNDNDQSGLVRIYDLSRKRITHTLAPTADGKRAKFGSTLAVSASGQLFIASRWWRRETGALWNWVLPVPLASPSPPSSLLQWALEETQAFLGMAWKRWVRRCGWRAAERGEAARIEMVARGTETGAGFGAAVVIAGDVERGERVVVGVPKAGVGKGGYGGVAVF